MSRTMQCLPAIRLAAILAALTFTLTGAMAPTAPVSAARAALASPTFPGPQLGAPTVRTPMPGDFTYSCNVRAATAAVHVAGTSLPVGAAMQNLDGCGQALLFLNTPAAGHFQATFAVSDAASAGSTGDLQLFVLGPGGFAIHTANVPVTKGTARPVDIDVSGGVSLAMTFLSPNPTFIYNMKLTGAARALTPSPLTGDGMPAGATAVPRTSITNMCNADPATAQSLVSDVVVPITGTVRVTGCGTITVRVPANSGGTLALRFGTDDSSDYSSIPTQVNLSVIDAGGHLLRKAVGLSYLGSGLQALWVSMQGGSTIIVSPDSNASGWIVVAGISFLSGRYAPHHNPDHQEFGSPSGAPVTISPDALVGVCNARVGTSATTIAHQSVPQDGYIWLTGCGIAELIMTNAHGRFQARVGVEDSTDPRYRSGMISLTVLDPNSHPLVQTHVTIRNGSPSIPISARIDGGSILEVREIGDVQAILYDMTLTGQATLYDRVFPPSEPPISTPGGMAIDPRAFAVSCNAAVSNKDIVLIHQAALEQWALYGLGCGVATLNLTALHAPRHRFSALFGMALQDQENAIAHLTCSVLDAKGTVLRKLTVASREGYGPRYLAISLAGGAKLQVTWGDNAMVLFAMTAA
ncbi:MAG TPA: hypothetical protein VHB98_04350 [Chloroflexota bacterium]|nr:hypothetical protein [Chloroflexota bacterium]